MSYLTPQHTQSNTLCSNTGVIDLYFAVVFFIFISAIIFSPLSFVSLSWIAYYSAPNAGRSKKAKGGKKRAKQHTQQQASMADQKRPKLEDDENDGLTGKDKQMLNRWKQFQPETRSIMHPVRKMIKSEDGEVGVVSVHDLQQQNQQQELIMKQQAVEIEKLKSELRESQREMDECVAVLKDRHKAIVHKCQAAGLTLPQELVADVKLNHSSLFSHQLQPSSTQQIISQSNSLLLQQPSLQNLVPHLPISSTSSTTASIPVSMGPPTSFSSSAMSSLPSYSTISPTNRTPPSATRILQGPPPPPIQPPAHQHHPVVSIVTLSSACTVDSIQNSSQQINPHLMIGGGRGMGNRMIPHLQQQQQQQQQQQHLQPSLMGMGGAQLGPGRMMLGGHTQYSRSHMSMSRPPTFPLGKNVPPGTGPMLLSDISFSPLTSSELNELENPSEMGEIFAGSCSSLMPITDDLDSILNIPMPSGSGAGYGVGVKEEELSRESLQLDLK